MTQVLGKMSWYLPVFGDTFLGIWPDFDKNIPRVLLRSPEYAYPFTGFDGEMHGVIFNWQVRESQLKGTTRITCGAPTGCAASSYAASRQTRKSSCSSTRTARSSPGGVTTRN
jgi:hypothetical protein